MVVESGTKELPAEKERELLHHIWAAVKYRNGYFHHSDNISKYAKKQKHFRLFILPGIKDGLHKPLQFCFVAFFVTQCLSIPAAMS